MMTLRRIDCARHAEPALARVSLGSRVAAVVMLSLATVGVAQADTPDDALAAARKATTFYWKTVSTKGQGGYLWRYSADLKLREGEGKASPTELWIQPPGTPAMGEAFTRLYVATGDKYFLSAAMASADALRRTQLRSGGWNDRCDLDPEKRGRFAYRTDLKGKLITGKIGRKQRNTSILDDDRTQSCIRFLSQLDQATGFKIVWLHEMTAFALRNLVDAQYANGAFAQMWEGPRHSEPGHEPKPASFPNDWPRSYQGHKEYWHRYTLNDNVMRDCIETLFLAGDIYAKKAYTDAALRGADFLIRAQLPDPQPAWAQQYNFDMQPCWARKFEPPAVTGGESQGAMRILLEAYRRTGDAEYLQPIPKAIAYLKRSKLKDGRLARFYEMKTNRPLYFSRDYKLTYDPKDSPTHYGFTVGNDLASIEALYIKMKSATAAQRKQAGSSQRSVSAKEAKRIINAMNKQGGWVTNEKLRFQPFEGPILNMAVAVKNLKRLADYLAGK